MSNASFNITIDTKEINSLGEKYKRVAGKIPDALAVGLKDAVTYLATEASKKHAYKDRTGKLSRSHRWKVERLVGSVYVLDNEVPYAKYLYYTPGRKRFKNKIVPKTAKALRWSGGDGKVHFSKWTRPYHPRAKFGLWIEKRYGVATVQTKFQMYIFKRITALLDTYL